MLKIGVLGAGHLGKIHLKCIKTIESYELLGFYDPDPTRAKEVAKEFNIKAFSDIDELIDAVDVVDIVTPTVSHFDCASRSLRKFKHVFIEKPIVATPAEARELIKIAGEAHVKVQVGHVERFNPAFLAAREFIQDPMFIESHRLAQFNPRGTDVPVVLDLMIHDIDIILNTVKSQVLRIQASGVCVISDTPDIANARIEFANGCVANLTASRLSLKNMRKSRFFQRDAYIAVDFLEKKTEIVRMKDADPENNNPFAMLIDLGNGRGSKEMSIHHPEIQSVNAIEHELNSFANAILKNETPVVTIEDGYAALDLAHRILERISLPSLEK